MLEERLRDYNLSFKVISLIRNLRKSSDSRYEEILKIMNDMREKYKREERRSNFDAIAEGSRRILGYLETKHTDLYQKIQEQLA